MIRILLDSNIYNCLEADEATRIRILEMITNETIEIVVSPVIVDELRESPFRDVPNFFPITRITESVFVVGIARVGLARVGKGQTFNAHRGESKKSKDAIIADTADTDCEILVSEDKRCRERLNKVGKKCKALSYAEFKKWLQKMQPT